MHIAAPQKKNIVWATLSSVLGNAARMGLMGWGAAMVSLNTRGKDRSIAIGLYLAQIMFNFFWSIIFFSWSLYGGALLWLAGLWLLVLWLVLRLRRQDPPGAKLLIPYQLWLTFALYLNFGVFLLNR